MGELLGEIERAHQHCLRVGRNRDSDTPERLAPRPCEEAGEIARRRAAGLLEPMVEIDHAPFRVHQMHLAERRRPPRRGVLAAGETFRCKRRQRGVEMVPRDQQVEIARAAEERIAVEQPVLERALESHRRDAGPVQHRKGDPRQRHHPAIAHQRPRAGSVERAGERRWHRPAACGNGARARAGEPRTHRQCNDSRGAPIIHLERIALTPVTRQRDPAQPGEPGGIPVPLACRLGTFRGKLVYILGECSGHHETPR